MLGHRKVLHAPILWKGSGTVTARDPKLRECCTSKTKINEKYDVITKGPSIKDVCRQGGRGLSSADVFRAKGKEMRTFALFGVKNFVFFKIYGVSARTRGVEPERRFFEQEGGQFFAILCGRPLWTSPKKITIGFGKYR